LHDLDHGLCPHCDYRIERDFIRCPSCLRKLKERCSNCSRPLDQAWTICPYCEADVPGIAPKRARRKRPPAPMDTELTQIDIEAQDGDAVAPVVAPEPAAPRGGGRSRRPRATP
jgi:hypothetical protein